MRAVLMLASLTTMAVVLQIPAQEDSVVEIPDLTVLAASTEPQAPDGARDVEQDDYLVVDADADLVGAADALDDPDGATAGLAGAADPAPLRTAPWTRDDVLAARAAASWCAAAIIDGEVGGVGYNPYAVGRAGERGAFQLHPQGELRTFYARGFDDPYDPWQGLRFTEQRLREGGGRAWTTAPRGCR